MYDVVVVGAGPAGSIAAYECAKKGLKTLLLEKCSLPRDKPCGGAVMYRGLQIVRGEVPTHIVEQKIYGLRFLLPNDEAAEFKTKKLIGITVFRSRFDEFLARRAEEQGAELVEEAKVVDASVNADSATVQLQDGRTINSQYLIGADGVNSVVSRSLGLRPARKDPYKVGLGMEADFYVGKEGVLSATNNDPSILEICPVEGRISYGWVFPKREHLAIGIAGASVHMHPLRPAFDNFIKTQEKRLGVKLQIVKRRTYFLGGDGLGSKNITKRAILIGDAAGFVDPMMGEGIAYAMKSGVHAASVICNCYELNHIDEKSLSLYQDLCADEFKANFEMARWAGVKGASFAETLLPRVRGHEMASEIMAMVARGEIGYSDIPATIIRRLPKELPKIIRQLVVNRMNHAH